MDEPKIVAQNSEKPEVPEHGRVFDKVRKTTAESQSRETIYDIQRKNELDYFMGRGLKSLDSSCNDRQDNGVLDD